MTSPHHRGQARLLALAALLAATTAFRAPVAASAVVPADQQAVVPRESASLAAASLPRPVLHWGFGGQVGATYLSHDVPAYASMPTAIAVAGGFFSSAALTPDGHVWTWGTNSRGQLGDGTNIDRAEPAPVPGLSGVVAIAAGSYHVLALKDDHTVWAWGFNQLGQLGNGSRTNSNVPVQVPGLSGVTAIAAGNQHSLALTSGGQLFAWGSDTRGQAGLGTPGDFHLGPQAVPGLATVTAIDAFADMSIAALADGTVRAWGDNHLGQLGDGTTTDRSTPVPNGVGNAVAVAAGGDAAAALLGDGTVATWGSNNHAMLGDGTSENRFTPALVPNLAGVRSIDAGFVHMVALKQDGSVWVWGSNADWGQLGLGQPIWYGTSVPVQVAAVTGVQAIGAGGASTLALGYLVGDEDTTPPSVTCAPPPSGWQSGDVSIACTAVDSESGLADPSDSSFALVTDVAAGVETAAASTNARRVCDAAGNCTWAGPFGGIMVDRKPPQVTLSAPAGAYTVNQAATAAYGCQDAGSGIAACSGPVGSGAAVSTGEAGTFTFGVTATDHAGHTATATSRYSVSYALCLDYDAGKAVRSGATIPIRLRLCDSTGTNLSSPAVLLHAQAITLVSTNASYEVQDAGEANPDSDFRYAGPGYIFNLKTTGLATGSYVLSFSAGADPAVHGAPFQVR